MTALTRTQAGSSRMPIWKALLLTLPMVPFTAIMLMQVLRSGAATPVMVIAALLIWILLTVSFALMLISGKTHRYRSALFILLAFLLPFYFIPNMIENYGTMMLSDEMIYGGEASFCPLTMPMLIVPAVLRGIVIFPGPIVAGGIWFVLWLGTSLAVGRGWCSWGCFYGGWDEFFSRLRKKPAIKRVDRKWTYLPFAVLLAIVLLSAVALSPIYCEWLCPFKTITEFAAPTSLKTIVTLGIFISLFISLVIALPLADEKAHPMRAFLSFRGHAVLFQQDQHL